MTQIQDVPNTAGFFNCFANGPANTLGRAEQDARVHIALQSDAAAKALPQFGQVHAPVHAQNAGTGLPYIAQQMIGSFRIENHGHSTGRKFSDQELRGRQSKLLVVPAAELSRPGVEHLNRSGAGGDLRLEVAGGRPGNLLQQRPQDTRLVVHHLFRCGKAVFGPALDHVAGQRPWRAGKSQHRDLRPELAAEPPDGLGHESSILLGIENPQRLHLADFTDGMSDHRAGVGQLHFDAHGFGGNQDVRKNDDGIHAHRAKRLQGNLHGQFRRLADFEKSVFLTHGPIIRQVAPSLAHHPDGNTLDGFRTAGAKEEFFAIRGNVCLRHRQGTNCS